MRPSDGNNSKTEERQLIDKAKALILHEINEVDNVTFAQIKHLHYENGLYRDEPIGKEDRCAVYDIRLNDEKSNLMVNY